MIGFWRDRKRGQSNTSNETGGAGIVGGITGAEMNLQFNPNANAFTTTTAFGEGALTSMLAAEYALVRGLDLGGKLLLSMGSGLAVDVATQKYEEYNDPSYQGFNYTRLAAATGGLPVAAIVPLSPFAQKFPTAWEIVNYGAGTYVPSLVGAFPWK